jgi:hypothetical protein
MFSVELSYQEDRLSTGMTVGVVLMGPLFNILILSLLSFFAFLFIRLSGAFPGILSKTILIYGIWCIFDPVAILIVDCILGRFGTDDAYSNDDIPIGDAFKVLSATLFKNFIKNSRFTGTSKESPVMELLEFRSLSSSTLF